MRLKKVRGGVKGFGAFQKHAIILGSHVRGRRGGSLRYIDVCVLPGVGSQESVRFACILDLPQSAYLKTYR